MPDLAFSVEGAQTARFSETPLINLELRIRNRTDDRVHSVLLRCQIMIDAARRQYDAQERARLVGLFGRPEQWRDTLRSSLWTVSNVLVPAFTGAVTVNVPVPCTFDFNIAATQYFAGLRAGEVPLSLLFSGTVFYEGEAAGLQVGQIPWDREAEYRLPVSIWRDLMDRYYPNTAWLCVRRDILDRLYEYRGRQALPTWERTLEALLERT